MAYRLVRWTVCIGAILSVATGCAPPVESYGTGGIAGTGGAGIGVDAGGASGSGGATTGTSGSMTGAGATSGTGGAMATGPTVITSANNAFWMSVAATVVTSGNADVTVNDGTALQDWEGFGGAFSEMGWSYLQMLSQADRDKAMQLLFGSDGAHFTLGRIPIGANDYALQRYTADEMANDTSLGSFSTNRDMMYLIPYIMAAQAINSGIRFWASPWTPPTWMKTNSGTVNNTSCARVGSTAYDGGCMQDVATNLTALAQYFVKWIQAYNGMGIPIDTLAPQNESSNAQGYPSAVWAPALFAKFIGQNLGPALSQANLNTKIMLGTMSWGVEGANAKDMMVVHAVMTDATAKGLVKMMGLQWGMLDLYEGKTSGVGPATFQTGSLPAWATEQKCGNYPWNPSGYPKYVEPAPNDLAYGVETWGYIRDAIKAGVTAYNAWNMVLDKMGKGNDTTRQWSQDALLVVDISAKKLILTPAYYVFRHAAQFTQPGGKVVQASGGDAIAFKNPDGSLIAVIYNSGVARTAIVSIGGKKVQFSMPGAGWATVAYKP